MLTSFFPPGLVTDPSAGWVRWGHARRNPSRISERREPGTAAISSCTEAMRRAAWRSSTVSTTTGFPLPCARARLTAVFVKTNARITYFGDSALFMPVPPANTIRSSGHHDNRSTWTKRLCPYRNNLQTALLDFDLQARFPSKIQQPMCVITSFVVEKPNPFDFRVDLWQHQRQIGGRSKEPLPMPKKDRPRTQGSSRVNLTIPELEHAKTAALGTLVSLHARRAYKNAIDKFIAWYCSEPRLGF